MKEQTIEIVIRDNTFIVVKKIGKRYWAEIIPRNKVAYWSELFTDWIGFTQKHPVYLNRFMCDSLQKIRDEIDYYIRIESVLKTYDDSNPYTFKQCQFCHRMLRKNDVNDSNAFFLSCGDHKQLAQLEAEKFFKVNPYYTQWRLKDTDRFAI